MRSVFFTSAFIALIFVVSCDSKSPAEDKPKSSDDRQTLDLPAGLAELTSDTATQAEPPKETPTYHVPETCTLEYRFRAEFSTKLKGSKRPAQGMVTDSTFEMSRGGPADFEITWGDILLAHDREGVERPGVTQLGAQLAETWLEATNGELKEVEGPTAAWSAFGTVPGPVIAFPKIPKRKGEKLEWAPSAYSQGSGTAVEIERGGQPKTAQQLPEPFALPYRGEIELMDWVSIQGERAALLQADWTASVSESTEVAGNEIQDSASLKAQAGYLVSEKGRVLLARVKSNATQEMKIPGAPDGGMTTQVATDSTLRLVKACEDEDATFAPPHKEQRTDERALTFLRDHRNKLVAQNYDEAAADFARSIQDQHGAELPRLLSEHFGRFGALSFGRPELANDTRELGGGRIEAKLGGTAENFEGLESGRKMTVHTHIEVGFEDDKPVIEVLGTDTTPKSEGWKLLTISDKRLHSKAQK